MPYILLIIALIIALGLAAKLYADGDVKKLEFFLRTSMLVFMGLLVVGLFATGRFVPAALLLLIALYLYFTLKTKLPRPDNKAIDVEYEEIRDDEDDAKSDESS